MVAKYPKRIQGATHSPSACSMISSVVSSAAIRTPSRPIFPKMLFAVSDLLAPPDAGEMDQAFLVVRPGGAGEAGDRDGHVRLRTPQCSLRHLAGDPLVDRAAPVDVRARQAQQIALGLLGIDHEPAVEHVTAPA